MKGPIDEKIKFLEERIGQLEAKKETKIPLLEIVMLFFAIFLAYHNFSNVLYDLELAKNLKTTDIANAQISDIKLTYSMFFEYFFVSIMAISLYSIIKGGFSKLKSYDEKGLIWGLILGLIAGLIAGLIGGLIAGLFLGLILGLIAGLIAGLILGLIWGLIWGLIDE